ncbi:uncharacterized protein TNCV_3252001 [Trichonephila clavipes]|nr:uncharacterized protein TNCV_3252001 [Trichonephila clavipes]
MFVREAKKLKFRPEGIQENGTWRRRSNFELYKLYKESDIGNFMKIQRIQWSGHAVKMDENRSAEKVFNAHPVGIRRKGRPNLRWIDGLEKVLRTPTWRTLAGRRLTC